MDQLGWSGASNPERRDRTTDRRDRRPTRDRANRDGPDRRRSATPLPVARRSRPGPAPHRAQLPAPTMSNEDRETRGGDTDNSGNSIGPGWRETRAVAPGFAKWKLSECLNDQIARDEESRKSDGQCNDEVANLHASSLRWLSREIAGQLVMCHGRGQIVNIVPSRGRTTTITATRARPTNVSIGQRLRSSSSRSARRPAAVGRGLAA